MTQCNTFYGVGYMLIPAKSYYPIVAGFSLFAFYDLSSGDQYNE